MQSIGINGARVTIDADFCQLLGDEQEVNRELVAFAFLFINIQISAVDAPISREHRARARPYLVNQCTTRTCRRYAFAMKHFVAAVRDAGARGGAVVNVASTSAFVAQPAFVPYSKSTGQRNTLDGGPSHAQNPAELPHTQSSP